MQRYGEFHRAQPGGEVTAGLTHGLDQEGAELLGQFAQLVGGQLAHIVGTVDGFQ